MRCLAFNEVKNEPCTGTAQYPFPCCDKECGWMYKNNMGRLGNVLSDKVDWKDLVGGIKNWSVGKYLYYINLK